MRSVITRTKPCRRCGGHEFYEFKRKGVEAPGQKCVACKKRNNRRYNANGSRDYTAEELRRRERQRLKDAKRRFDHLRVTPCTPLEPRTSAPSVLWFVIEESSVDFPPPPPWWHEYELSDLCQCGHECQDHGHKTSTCVLCECDLFRPAGEEGE